jgi:hypothetical protein
VLGRLNVKAKAAVMTKAFQLLGEIHSLKLGRVAAWAGFFTASPWLSVYAYWTVTKLCIIEQYSFHYLFTKLRGE